MIHIGISSFAYDWSISSNLKDIGIKAMTSMDIISEASVLNVEVVQLSDNIKLENMDRRELEVIKKYADQKAIKLEIGFRGLYEENINRFLQIAEILKVDLIRVVVDSIDYKPAKETIVEVLNKFETEFLKRNITCVLENHDRFKADDFIFIMEKVNLKCYGICLDTVNSLGALEGPDYIINKMRPYTKNIHIKDFIIKRQNKQMGFVVVGTTAGKGMLDIPSLLKEFTDKNLSVLLELWPPFLGNIKDTIILERNWVKASILYLKTLI